MQIDTKNLFLRKLTTADVSENYVAWLNDEGINKYLETRHEKQTLASCKAFVEACNQDVSAHLFGIFLKSNNCHIGNIKIGFINEKYKRGELSILIGLRDLWGKGFGTESVKALSKYAFDFLGLEKIEAGCYEDNFGSMRIFLKSGFVVEGFRRGHVVRDDKRLGCFLLGLMPNDFK
jgi:[ribosomal protein S5]-alanine N-acetyltransferase